MTSMMSWDKQTLTEISLHYRQKERHRLQPVPEMAMCDNQSKLDLRSDLVLGPAQPATCCLAFGQILRHTFPPS